MALDVRGMCGWQDEDDWGYERFVPDYERGQNMAYNVKSIGEEWEFMALRSMIVQKLN